MFESRSPRMADRAFTEVGGAINLSVKDLG